MDLSTLAQESVVKHSAADVARIREQNRRRRWWMLLVVLLAFAGYLVYKMASGHPVDLFGFRLPSMSWLSLDNPYGVSMIFMVVLVLVIGGPMLLAGRSPHILFRPSEIDTAMDDVVGLPNVKEEVIRSLNLFLGSKTFRERMGGNPRRGLLFEGPPGTGKTYIAKAMAHDAGVPFLFVSASSFQSMYYGQTNRKIRTFFKGMRKAARKEGGAIGFIDEFDAIGGSRRGMRSVALNGDLGGPERAAEKAEGVSEGVSGIVNELLVQLQSFDTPTFGQRARGAFVNAVNAWLPYERQLRKPLPKKSNVLVIGATNRADNLDPALLRPGRFDRTIHFDLPSRQGRRDILDYYLGKKAHDTDLDRDDRRDSLAGSTVGYTPVMLEHVLDEALVWALRDGRGAMSWADVQQAKMTEETGIKQPVEYTADERRRIATHEAGHAVVAYLEGKGRKLDVLSIVKRSDALGLLSHSDVEERFTMTRSELLARVQIAMGGLVAEEAFFTEWSTGPGSDLQFATSVAAQMIGSFGMGGSFISMDAVEMTGIVRKVLSDEPSRKRVDELLYGAHSDVQRLLAANTHLVEALRDALIERDELVGDEILDVLRAADEVVDLREVAVQSLLDLPQQEIEDFPG